MGDLTIGVPPFTFEIVLPSFRQEVHEVECLVVTRARLCHLGNRVRRCRRDACAQHQPRSATEQRASAGCCAWCTLQSPFGQASSKARCTEILNPRFRVSKSTRHAEHGGSRIPENIRHYGRIFETDGKFTKL